MPIYPGHAVLAVELLLRILDKQINDDASTSTIALPPKRPGGDQTRASIELEQRVDRLTILCAAMWEIVKETTAADDDVLLKIAEAVDKTDGKLDGKVRHPATPCPACKRMVGQRRRVCMYCGEKIRKPPFTTT